MESDEEALPPPGQDVGDALSYAETATTPSQARATVRFAGCYLLKSLKRERTYVGFTVNPTRRLKQHNGEIPRGGAARTSVNRPWTMLAVVHGFVTTGQALQFEWAWQNPGKAKSLRVHAGAADSLPLAMKRSRHPTAADQLAALASLLSVPPWSHSPLTVTVPGERTAWSAAIGNTRFPAWVRVDFRPVAAIGDVNDYDFGSCEAAPGLPLVGPCGVCSRRTDVSRRGTFCVECGQVFHVHCLASPGTGQRGAPLPAGALLPARAECCRCKRQIPWSEVVRFARVVRRGLTAPPAVTDTSTVPVAPNECKQLSY
jgi:structure-specific endonuclease subunit SLX1